MPILPSAKVRRPLQLLFMAVSCIAFAGYLFGENLHAQWWIIDDHEIMWAIGPGEHLSLDQFVPKLMETEVGRFGEYARFRPIYYVMRLAESALWGKQPALWYGFRLFIFAFFAFVVWYEMQSGIGVVSSGLLTVFTMTFGFWSDVFARLGPSEAYAALALALFLLGFGAVRREVESKKGWLLLLIGTVVATGSKENFLVLMLPMAFLVADAISDRKALLFACSSGILALAWCIWIGVAVVLGVGRAGGDVYGNPTSLPARGQIVWLGAGQPSPVLLFLLAGMLIVLGLFFRRRRPLVAKLSVAACLGVSFSICLYLSQIFFYGTGWPTGDRYDLPGILAVPLALFVMFWYLQHLIRLAAFPAWLRSGAPALIVVMGLAAAASHLGGIPVLRQNSLNNVWRTEKFTTTIANLARLASEHPNFPLVFQSNELRDYEPLFSYPRFLLAARVQNDSYLLWANRDHYPQDSFAGSLSRRLSQVSNFGLPPYYWPIEGLGSAGEQCILVVLSGAQAEWQCSIQVDGDWHKY